MKQKTCRECRHTQPLGDFYRSKSNADGYFNRCRHCCLKYSREMRESAKGDILRAKGREYARTPEGKAARARYLATPEGREARRIANRWWRLTHPDAYRAQNARSTAKLRAKRKAAKAAATVPHHYHPTPHALSDAHASP